MNEQSFNVLSIITFFPFIVGIFLLLLPKALEKIARPILFTQSIVSLILALILYNQFDAANAGYQFLESFDWLPQWGIQYILQIDGISLPLVMLTAFVSPLAIMGTWPSEDHRPKFEKYLCFFIAFLQTGMYGTFLAGDLFLFYFFWEIVLIPMFFMIGIWGGENRIYATTKFFIYTLVGSLLMLVAIIIISRASYAFMGGLNSSFTQLSNLSFTFDGSSWMTALLSPQSLLFLAFTFAFIIKVPMIPFHTWLPDAHVQAPTIGSVFLAAVLLKMGTYGLMRIAVPMFPQASMYFSSFFIALGVAGIIYGAFCALAQKDFKRLVAYSSVSHMGYVVMGLFSFNKIALAGSLYQMINHGISAGGLFLIVGFLYERLHTRNLLHFGGLMKIVPLMGIAFLLVTLSSVALPGTNGFTGEFPILLGSFQNFPYLTVMAGLGVIFGAVYALKAFQMVMLGPIHRKDLDHLHDLNFKEILTMLILTFFIIGIGFFPQTFFSKSQSTLENYGSQLEKIYLAK